MLKSALASADLSLWPAVALVVFAVFMLLLFLWIMRPSAAVIYERARRSVLDDDDGEGKDHG